MPEIPVTEVTSLDDDFERLIRPGTLDQPTRDEHFYDVRITAPDTTGIGARIELDGVPMKGVRSYSVRVGVLEANEVTVTFIAASVNREDPDDEHPAGPA